MPHPSRRELLKVGALGMGLGLSDLLRLHASGAAEPASSQRSVIILYMRGGPSQLDTWDMKPDAPAEIRGEFRPIATTVSGIHLCELLPLSARVMRHWSIVRSLHHRPEDGPSDHSRGDQIVFTGYPPGPNESDNVHPSVGSVVARQLQTQNPRLPAYVMIPRMIPGTDAAYLGQACRPFETQADPANVGPFEVPNLGMARGLGVEVIGERRQMLSRFDALRTEADRTGTMQAMDRYQQQAWDMLTSDRARRAFDLDAEPQHVRDRYGYSKSFMSRVRAGGDAPGWNQRVLLARRLVEAGVRLVTVDLRWWDTHEDNFWSLENGFLPRFDQCYSALIDDLQQRGLLESTLVVAWGEHGRTPRINSSAGRDHWGNCFSAAIAGGGTKGGRIVGESDQHAGQPKTNAKIPQDVLATIYRHLGIDPNHQFLHPTGRPISILPCGQPIDELF